MSRRMFESADGLKISKPGQDAYYASAMDLLFSTLFPHMMMAGSGTFTLATGGNTIAYDALLQATSPPKVFCGLLESGGLRYGGFGYMGAVATVKTTHIVSGGVYTGFTAIGVAGYQGAKYADGQVCTWAAYING